MKFRIVTDPEIEARHAAYLATQKAEILAGGKPNFRYVSSRGIYAFYAGRKLILGVSFDSPDEGWEWLKETHGMDKPESK